MHLFSYAAVLLLYAVLAILAGSAAAGAWHLFSVVAVLLGAGIAVVIVGIAVLSDD